MSYFKSKLFLLYVGLNGEGGQLAGLKNLSMKISNDSVDVSNKSSGGWRELMEGAGLQSLDLSCDGLCNDVGQYKTLKQQAQANAQYPFQIVFPDNSTVSCMFHISDFTTAGGYTDALTFSCSMVSTGQPIFTNA